jgi:hypothetical protein
MSTVDLESLSPDEIATALLASHQYLAMQPSFRRTGRSETCTGFKQSSTECWLALLKAYARCERLRASTRLDSDP